MVADAVPFIYLRGACARAEIERGKGMNQKASRYKWLQQWLFVGPALLVFTAIVLAPFLLGIYYSFTDFNGVSSEQIRWVGFENFRYILTEDQNFRSSFWFTVKFTVTTVILVNLIAFCLPCC